MTNKAFCFDLNGTVAKYDIISLMGKELDIFEEVRILTDASSKGEILPLKSFLLRLEMIKDLNLSKTQELIYNMEINKHIFKFIESYPENCFILTSSLDVWIEKFIKRFRCEFFTSKAKVEDEKVVGVEYILNKRDCIKSIKSKFDEVIAIGSDMGDVEMLQFADRSIAFPKTVEPVQSLIEESEFVTFNEKGLCNILNTLL